MPSTEPQRGLRRATGRGVARVAALIGCCLTACAALALVAGSADAHPLSTTAVLLDIGSDQVTGQVQLPIDRLAIALDQPLTATVIDQPAKLDELRRYVAAHLSATNVDDGAAWVVSTTGARVGEVDNVDHLLVDIRMRPPSGVVRDLTLHYDGIVHRLISHRILVSARPVGADTYTAVGVIDWQSQTVTVPAQNVTAQQGFLAAVTLGIHHIAEGADHLLFLLMLLLPAPLLAKRGRWGRAGDLRHQAWRTLHVVSAFAVGHSLTLALAALGYVSVPSRIVESMIAVSILASGVHAIRPILRGGEVWIAGGFGLMHGLGFAALLGQLDLGRGSLVVELLGFNLGIELAQLIVVALVMPSLVVLSRSGVYATVRTGLAVSGVVFAAGWLAERTTVIDVDPFESISTTLVSHPWAVPAALAFAAAVTMALRPRRTSSKDSSTARLIVSSRAGSYRALVQSRSLPHLGRTPSVPSAEPTRPR